MGGEVALTVRRAVVGGGCGGREAWLLLRHSNFARPPGDPTMYNDAPAYHELAISHIAAMYGVKWSSVEAMLDYYYMSIGM